MVCSSWSYLIRLGHTIVSDVRRFRMIKNTLERIAHPILFRFPFFGCFHRQFVHPLLNALQPILLICGKLSFTCRNSIEN